MSQDLPPVARPYYPPPPPRRSRVGLFFLWLFFILSIALNVLLCGGVLLLSGARGAEGVLPLNERYLSGTTNAADKVAVIRMDGAIMDGLLGFVHKQIDEAASDNSVKAVVLHVNSPGGTITGSDDLLERLIQLRDGTTPKYKGKSNPKPIVVSMGSVAASGGYYISMAAAKDPNGPQKKIFAERTCITGSIGVYASLPNAKGLGDKIGLKMEMIKAGDIKGSGSLFHDMTPAERQPWQDMVASSYQQFIEVVETGRPELKGKLTENLFPPKEIPTYDDKGNVANANGATYTRKRADGGIFTAKEALENGLIDAIGRLDDSAAEAASQAKLVDYRVIRYEKPITIWGALAGEDTSASSELKILSHIDLAPRLWYLMPSAEGAARVGAR
ncbi:MAG: S49 family peptidase [Gemmataceae bacterium]